MISKTKPMSTTFLIYKFVKQVFPLVKQELARWREAAENSAPEPLAQQAVASISAKSFHCLGGSIYALYPGVNTQEVVEFIVAYQTISDYLDNLVDSLGVHDEQAFAQLHLAMTESLNPDVPTSDYYQYYPYHDDGGYLSALVETCRAKVAGLQAYHLVKADMLRFAELYSRLQTLKHLQPDIRETRILAWLAQYRGDYPLVSAWEFAAATGSTLGIFSLYAAACSGPSAAIVRQISQAYFPWICGLHILLDYFIDLEEDRASNQLNFVSYYTERDKMAQHLQLFVQQALEQAATLPYPSFHRAVVQGLLALYLSDSKALLPGTLPTTQKLLAYGGSGVKLLQRLCIRLRGEGIL